MTPLLSLHNTHIYADIYKYTSLYNYINSCTHHISKFLYLYADVQVHIYKDKIKFT